MFQKMLQVGSGSSGSSNAESLYTNIDNKTNIQTLDIDLKDYDYYLVSFNNTWNMEQSILIPKELLNTVVQCYGMTAKSGGGSVWVGVTLSPNKFEISSSYNGNKTYWYLKAIVGFNLV